MRIKVGMRPSPHTGKVIVAMGVFSLALWIAIALMFTVYRDEPSALALLRNFIYLTPRLGPPMAVLVVCWIAHRAIANPHSNLSMKIAANAPAAAARILPVLGVSLLALCLVWLASVVLITTSSHEPTPLLALQALTYVGLWLVLPVFVLLTAGIAIRAKVRNEREAD